MSATFSPRRSFWLYLLLFLLGRFENLEIEGQHYFAFLINFAAYLERTQQALIYAHHCTCIVEFTAIVRCTEEGHQLSFREELISVLHDLMSSANKVHVVLLQEAGNDIGSEGERHTAVVFTPAGDILVRV